MSALTAARAANAQVSLIGKNAVVVGGTSGIGQGLSIRLAKAGASVTIVGRSQKRGAAVLKEMQDAAPKGGVTGGDGEGEACATPTFRFVSCDCFLLKSVGVCVDALLRDHADRSIDYLVQSQGMATIQGFTPSAEEGLDQKLALHVYSRAAFAAGLQPALARSDDPRALSVLSAGVHAAYGNHAADPELSLGSYSIKNAADAAGFYNDILADSLSRAHPSVAFLHAAPGFVATRWGVEMPTPIRWLVRGLQAMGGRSVEDNAEYMLRGLANPEHKAPGFWLLDQYGAATAKVTAPHDAAREEVFAHIEAVLAAGGAVAGKDKPAKTP